jgi:hypothetical protein
MEAVTSRRYFASDNLEGGLLSADKHGFPRYPLTPPLPKRHVQDVCGDNVIALSSIRRECFAKQAQRALLRKAAKPLSIPLGGRRPHHDVHTQASGRPRIL